MQDGSHGFPAAYQACCHPPTWARNALFMNTLLHDQPSCLSYQSTDSMMFADMQVARSKEKAAHSKAKHAV